MTTEIERQFYDTFEIEPNTYATWNSTETQMKNFKSWDDYPQITDRILLELICICNNTYINGYTNYFTSVGKTIEEIKKEILKKCIFLKDDIKHQVRTLFKGE